MLSQGIIDTKRLPVTGQINIHLSSPATMSLKRGDGVSKALVLIMKTCHRLLKASVHKTAVANSVHRHETTKRNGTF